MLVLFSSQPPQPGNGPYIPPRYQNDASSYGGSALGMLQNGNGQRRHRGGSRGQYGGHPGGDDFLPQQIGVPSGNRAGNRAGGQQNDASSVADSTFIDSMADDIH